MHDTTFIPIEHESILARKLLYMKNEFIERSGAGGEENCVISIIYGVII